MSDMRLDGQTAVVTGGTRGIGRGIADIFLENGANVVVNGRSAEKGEQAIKEMGGGDNVHFIAGRRDEEGRRRGPRRRRTRALRRASTSSSTTREASPATG